MRVYKLVRCTRCGHLQITSAKKSYRCFGCGYVNKVENIIYESENLEDVRMKLLKLKSARSSKGLSRADT